MTDEQKPSSPPDWSRLAIEALDLWQNHVTTLANDPVAKAELARMMQPVGQMAAEWARMMQAQNPYANGQNTQTTNSAANSAAGSDAPAPATGGGAAAPAGSGAATRTATSTGTGSDDASGRDGVDSSGLSEPSISDAVPSAGNTPVAAGVSADNAAIAGADPSARDTRADGKPPASDRADGKPAPSDRADGRPSAAPSADVGNAAPAAGSGDMAQLAQRLAELERRMDERKSHARFKRRDDLENMDEPAERQASAASGG